MYSGLEFEQKICSERHLILLLDDPKCDPNWLLSITKDRKENLFLSNKEDFLVTDVTAIYCEFSQKLSGDYLSRFSNLTTIATPATSLTHIDLAYCELHSIDIISLKNFPEEIEQFTSTVEIALWHLLELLRSASSSVKSVNAGNWSRNDFIGTSLYGKRIGILGYGRLGKKMANVCSVFGAQVSIFDLNPHKAMNIKNEIRCLDSIEELFSFNEVVSIHIDDRPTNKNIINDGLLRNIPISGAHLINTSRGFLVDEDAIVRSLRIGRLLGYGTDVLGGEEIGTLESSWLPNNPIYQGMIKENLKITITPHIGGATKETMLASSQLVLDALFKKHLETNFAKQEFL
jgi:D-3-phosphoglycerate dehydrogenase